MKIEMTKRKPGVYAQWFEIIGLDSYGKLSRFLIYQKQAKTYRDAINFWKENWEPRGCKALVLKNAEPFPDTLFLAC